MTLRANELADACAEIERALAGRPTSKVQKVVQPDRATVLVGLAKGWLLLSCDARLGRVHVTSKPAGTGDAPPAFCMLLRKELIGARLESCRAIEGERACELVFAGAGGERRLRLFLFGRASQLQLAGDEGRVLGHIGPAKSVHAALPEPREAQEEAGRFGEGDGIGARIDEHYRREAGERAAAEAKQAALSQLKAELERHRRKLEALAGDRARAESAVDKRKVGDLLLAHLAEVPRGAGEITLPDDFEGGAPLRIALDPSRSARANAEKFYKEHKRLSRALTSIDERLQKTRALAAKAEAELARIESGEGLPAAALVPRTAPPAKKSRVGAPPPYRAYRASTGAQILVGRGADKNDELTFQVARGSDLWLHTRDVPGAHVIVRLPPNGRIDEQTLLDAATLAAHHSSARGEAQVDVGYTLRKHVRKPPKSKPGTVTFSSLKTLRVRLEPARLERLLASVEE